jgi:hypothetical protein
MRCVVAPHVGMVDARRAHSANRFHSARRPTRLVEVVPDKKVVWLVLDSYLSFPEDKTEWNGTKVIFEVARKGNKTEVRFTHEGLVLDYQCFDKCSSAWGFYINDSLKSLITTGKGDPNKRGR